ncbi:unnamed protein product [Cuscuta campestris]|uniref:Uncharacterized protein n=1 Tax=Cuscuta campestris TaxID=132261 RepID=A0A484KX99_9ASTE|nr:unnamed protein product [Cuscuta campestris]
MGHREASGGIVYDYSRVEVALEGLELEGVVEGASAVPHYRLLRRGAAVLRTPASLRSFQMSSLHRHV